MSAFRTSIGELGPENYSGALIEISSGMGGKDAEAFVADLLQMYRTFAKNHGWSTEVMLQQETSDRRLKLVLLKVFGEGAYPRLKTETGVQRVQRVQWLSRWGGQERIHTSTACVAVMPIPDELSRLEKIRTYSFPEDEVRDHRHKVKVREVRRIMDGDLDLILGNLPDNG